LEALLPLIQQNRHTDWQKTIANWRKLDFNPAAHCAADDPALHPYQIMRTISHYAGEDAVYVTDVGQHQLWAAQYCRHLKPRSFLTSGGLGTMGFGYGAAIGAAMADTGRPIVHITGDGSFHMNLNEACTAVSYHTPIVTVICDNRVLGMVRQWQKAFYGGRYSATDPERKTDFVQLAAGFGLPAFACETPAQFETLFPKALAIAQTEHTPVWLACRIGKDEKVLPMIPAGGTVDNIITE
jgi:acetolactate synthase-1/2/3 large subunit